MNYSLELLTNLAALAFRNRSDEIMSPTDYTSLLSAASNNKVDDEEDAANLEIFPLALLLKLRLAAEAANNEQRSMDSSGRKAVFAAETPYLLVLASIIFLLSLVANVLVIISVFRSRRYRATAGLLALNLTVADLLITVVLLPLWMVQQNLSTSDSYLLSIMVCKIHPALLTMSVGASAYTLVALSVDRMCIVRLNNAVRVPSTGQSTFFSSNHDLSSMTRRRRRSSLIISWLCCCHSRLFKILTVAAPWLLSLFVAAPVLYFRTAQEPPKIEEIVQVANLTSIRKILKQLHDGVSPESSCREEWPVPLQLAYDQSLLVIHFALPAIVQLCLYIYLGWVVSRLTAIPATRNSQANDSCATMTLVQQQTLTQQQTSGVQGRGGGGANSPPLLPNGLSPCHQSSNNNRQAYGSLSVVRRQRAWRTLIALSVLFPISWLPYYILYTYLVNADPAAIGPRTTSLHTLLELFAMLGFSNSAQNAIVYCATDDRLRGSVKSLLSMIPCVNRWHARQSRLISLNGGNGYIGHNNCGLAYGNNNTPVMLQMNHLTPQRLVTPSPQAVLHAQTGQGQGQAAYQKRQFNGSNSRNNQQSANANRLKNNNNNNYMSSPKLLAPPVQVMLAEDHHLNNNNNSSSAQQQRLRAVANAKYRHRKRSSSKDNNIAINNDPDNDEDELAAKDAKYLMEAVEIAVPVIGRQSEIGK